MKECHAMGVGWLCAMAVILSLCSVKSARADSVVFSNLGSPISFSTSTGWEIIPGANVATQFTPSADVAVSQIDVGIGNITGLPTGISNGVNFAVYTNVSGSPRQRFWLVPRINELHGFWFRAMRRARMHGSDAKACGEFGLARRSPVLACSERRWRRH